MKKVKISKSPFFAKFLEKQILDDTKDLKGGGPKVYETMKYPSDGDEGIEI